MVMTTSMPDEQVSDNDSISLTSTILSTHSEDELFEVQRILAENPDNKKKTYLIQWVGYPISRATWEPKKQIQHLRHIISEWRERLKQQASGNEEPFDTQAWIAARSESENERQSRKIRRANKRKRLQRSACQEIDCESQASSRASKKKLLSDCTKSEINIECHTTDEPEIVEKLKKKPDNRTKSKSLRAKRKVISDDDDDDKINNRIEQSSAALNLRYLDSPCMSTSEARTQNSPVSTIQINISAQSSPESSNPSASTHARKSSSSDESLAETLRRSKATKAAYLAGNSITNMPPEQSNALVADHISSSSSSDDAPLAKRLPLPIQSSRLEPFTSVSQCNTRSNPIEISPDDESSPSTRKEHPSIRRKNTSSSPEWLPHSTKRTRRRGSRRKINLSPKPAAGTHSRQETPLNHPVKIPTKENQINNLAETSSTLDNLNMFVSPRETSLCEQIAARPLEKDANIDTQILQSSNSMYMVESGINLTNENNGQSKQSVLSHEKPNTSSEVTSTSLNYCSLDQRVDRSDLKKLANNGLNINYTGSDFHSQQPLSNSLGNEVQKGLTPFYNQINPSGDNNNQDTKFEALQSDLAESQTSGNLKSSRGMSTHTNHLPPNLVLNPEKSVLNAVVTSLADSSRLVSESHSQEESDHGIQTNNSTNDILTVANSSIPIVQKHPEMNLKLAQSSAPLCTASNSQVHNTVAQYSLESNNFAGNPSSNKESLPSASEQVLSLKSKDENLDLGSSSESERNRLPSRHNEHQNLSSKTSTLILNRKTYPPKNQTEMVSRDPEKKNCMSNAEETLKTRTCQSYNTSNLKAQVITPPKNQEKKNKKNRTKKTCKYWLANNCGFGSSCWFTHDISSTTSPGNNTKIQVLADGEKGVDPSANNDSHQTKQKIPEHDSSSEDSIKSNLDSTIKSSEESLVQPSLKSIIHPEIENLDQSSRNEDGVNSSLAEHNLTEPVSSQVPEESEFHSQLIPNSKSVSVTEANPVYISIYSQKHSDSNQNDIKAVSCMRHVVIGNDCSSPISLNFGDIDTITDDNLKKKLTSPEKIYFNKSCMAQDFQKLYMMSRFTEVWQGNIGSVNPYDQNATKIIDMIFNELVIRCSGLTATVGESLFLIFPVRREEWRFLDRSPDLSSEFRLRYSVFSNKFFKKQQDLSSNCNSILFHQQLYPQRSQKILIMNMLEHFLPGVGNCSPECRFYLLFPPASSEIADLVKFCLISHNSNFKLYGSLTEGSWDMFIQPQLSIQPSSSPKECFDRIVIIHEVSATELWRIPKLSSILLNTDMTFWQISDGTLNYPPYPSYFSLPKAKLGQISATRLFPHGCAILLTPSFLVAEPREALEFIKWFDIEKYQMRFPLWRLVGAHNLPSYVLDVAKSKASEASSYEKRHLKDPRKNSVMKERSLDYSICNIRWGLSTELAKLSQPSNDELESVEDFESCLIQAPSFINPDNEHELIRWFAAWSAINSDLFRKFIVIGTDSSSASQAKYLKEVPKTYRDSNSTTTKMAASQSSTNLVEIRSVQKTRHAEKLSPPSKTQAPDTLTSKISHGKISDSPDETFSRTSNISRYESDFTDLSSSRSKNPTDSHDIYSTENGEGTLRCFSKSSHTQSNSLKNPNRIERNDDQVKGHYEDSVGRTLAPSETGERFPVIQHLAIDLKEQQFEATTEWYQRLKARGSGWEHITVTEHLEAWRMLDYKKT